MHETAVTIAISVLTLATCAASVLALLRLRINKPTPNTDGTLNTLALLCTLGTAGVFIYRETLVTQGWAPLTAHVDGLLLIATLVGATVVYLQSRARLPGVSAFALPVMAFLLLWAICASAWTLKVFNIASVYLTLHLAAVYVGSAFLALASIAGMMYLVAQRRLHDKTRVARPGRFASLESIETFIVRMSTVGFAVLTLGLVMGLVIISSHPDHYSPGWWLSPKIILSTLVWLLYALVMNVRYTSLFRGKRAAWMSIAGMVLLIATFAVATALPMGTHNPDTTQQPPHPTQETP
ncbi:MAG: hypothetical protein GC164_12655 [Phycisphaera sp.]|nr:hypothetical protein [Phycisphaera sp.]